MARRSGLLSRLSSPPSSHKPGRAAISVTAPSTQKPNDTRRARPGPARDAPPSNVSTAKVAALQANTTSDAPMASEGRCQPIAKVPLATIVARAPTTRATVPRQT